MAGDKIMVARQACYAVAKSLDAIKGVNVGVSAFPTWSIDGYAVIPITRHGEKVKDNFGLDAGGGTPLASSLWWVMQTLACLKERRKIILLLTDGQPNDLAAANAAIERIQRLRVEIYGIGIQTTSIELLNVKRSRSIAQLSELAPAMFAILQNAMLPGGGHAHAH